MYEEFNFEKVTDKELATQLKNIDSAIFEANKPFKDSVYDKEILESIKDSIKGLAELVGPSYNINSNAESIKSEINFDNISIYKIFDYDSNIGKVSILFNNMTQLGYFSLDFKFLELYAKNLYDTMRKNNIDRFTDIICEEEFGQFNIILK